MNDILRLLIAGSIGSVLTLVVVAAPPVLATGAGEVAQQAAPRITSAQIKNGTIKRKDLSAGVVASLGRADTALQGVPDGAVTTAKLRDQAVTEDKLAADSVASSEVADGSLDSGDLSSDHGNVVLDFDLLAPGECGQAPGLVDVSGPLAGDLVVVSPPASFPGEVLVQARVADTTQVTVWACNLSPDPLDLQAFTYAYAVIEN